MVRKGCLLVDYETLDSARKAKGLSKQKLARLADVAVGNLDHWKKGGGAKPDNLEAVAKVLGFRSYRPLVANDPPPSHVGEPLSHQTRFRKLLRDAFMSQGFAHWAASEGGFDVADFYYFVRFKCHEELYTISLSDAERNKILEEFCRAGLLERIQIEKGPKKGLEIIRQRPWTPRQLADALELRILLEQAAARRVVMLRADPTNLQCREEYNKIRDKFDELLGKMALANEDHRLDHSDQAAHSLIDLDSEFHLAWAGTNTCYILCLQDVMQEIRQAVDLFVCALRLAQENLAPLPPNVPTLQELTGDFYKEVSALYKAFLNASPDDPESMQTLDLAISDHAHAGCDVLEQAETLLKHIRGY
ncbi:MAG: hypothetical protein GXP26_13275 [Planctomycetes bacterium]|nr:hypothetical protein [Planctomycetota bacterium]